VIERRPALKVGEGGGDGQRQEQRPEAVRRDPAPAERVQTTKGVPPLPTVGVSADLVSASQTFLSLVSEGAAK